MDANTEINRVAIVGTGLIGSSWAACFLAHGLDVVATGPAPGTEVKVRQYVEAAWAALTEIGLAQGASTSRLRFESNLKEALAGADMVQELSPELQKKIVDGVLEEVNGRSFEALSRERDNLIMGLLELLSHRRKAEPVAASGHTADDS
jgi:hypothetical protein